MIDFLTDNLLLLPFLFITYLVLEALEARAGGALERGLGRARRFGPLFGALAGVFPQCGFSAAAASLYAGGAITAGTLAAVFLSTSDELIPVLLSEKAPIALVAKILAVKVAAGVAVGFAMNRVLALFGKREVHLHMEELCSKSHCGCREHKGILVPALIHTGEIFLFILIFSGIAELLIGCVGEDGIRKLILNDPWIGEMLAGLLGLIPTCAISVSGAQLYLMGGMSPGAMLAMSLTGSGVGWLVLFRTHRHWKENLAMLATLYVCGVVIGRMAGIFI